MHGMTCAFCGNRLFFNCMEALDTLFVFRLTMFFGLVMYASGLLANILETLDTFNPSYWRHYVRQHCIRPLIGLLVFAFLLLVGDRVVVAWLSN